MANEFNGMTQVEIEMMRDQINKALPTLVNVAPAFTELTLKFYEEYNKRKDLNKVDKLKLSVDSAAKLFKLG